MNLIQLSQNLKKLNLNNIYKEVITSFETEILDLNKLQLERGADSDNIPLPEYASLSYTEFKQRIGSKSGTHYDLKVSGNFWNGFFANLDSNLDLQISSKDPKTDDLIMMTSEEIFGLSDEYTEFFVRTYFLPKFLKLLRKQLGL